MFTIHSDGKGFVLSRELDPANSLRVADLSELLALRSRINRFVDDQVVDSDLIVDTALAGIDQISTAEARKLATEHGYDIPPTTLVSAVSDGRIEGAHKRGGRWYAPQWAFEKWMEAWAARQA